MHHDRLPPRIPSFFLIEQVPAGGWDRLATWYNHSLLTNRCGGLLGGWRADCDPMRLQAPRAVRESIPALRPVLKTQNFG
jgi:hypothetical protein